MQFVIPLTLTDRFAYIIGAICQAIGRRGCPRTSRLAGLPRLDAALLFLIVRRLRRYAARFTRIAAAVAASPSSAPFPIAALRPPRARRPPPPLGTPRGHAWLLRLVPEVTGPASQLHHLLTDPELAALLEACPSLARTLRPLCRMLGIRRLPSPAPSPVATLLFTPRAAPRTIIPPPQLPSPAPQPPASPPDPLKAA